MRNKGGIDFRDVCKDLFINVMASSVSSIDQFAQAISGLTINSKNAISAMTNLARNLREYGKEVISIIVNRTYKTNPEYYLSHLYLFDSIVKNIKDPYLTIATNYVEDLFLFVFKKTDERVRVSLYKLFITWIGIFDINCLQSLTVKVRSVDPKWPISDVRSFLKPRQTSSTNSGEFSQSSVPSDIPSRNSSNKNIPSSRTRLEDLRNEQAKLDAKLNDLKRPPNNSARVPYSNPQKYSNPDSNLVPRKRQFSPTPSIPKRYADGCSHEKIKGASPRNYNKNSPPQYQADEFGLRGTFERDLYDRDFNFPISHNNTEFGAVNSRAARSSDDLKQYHNPSVSVSSLNYTCLNSSFSDAHQKIRNEGGQSVSRQHHSQTQPKNSPKDDQMTPSVKPDLMDIIKQFVSKAEDKSNFNAKRNLNTAPPLVLIKEKKYLQTRNTTLIGSLHEGKPCSNCGLRFRESDLHLYPQHLDQHYRDNLVKSDTNGSYTWRPYYSPSNVWLLQFGPKIIDEPKNQNQNELKSCIATSNVFTETCTICRGEFETFWNVDKKEWHYKNAIRVSGTPYHDQCYQIKLSNTTVARTTKQET